MDRNLGAQAPNRSEAAAAPTEVTFHLSYEPDPLPVEVTHIMLGDKEVPLDTPVSVSGKWLRTLRIVVQNTSSKTLVTGEVSLFYPETGDGSAGRPMLSSPLELGKRPTTFFRQKDGGMRDSSRENQIPELNVLPGQSMVFSFPAYGGEDHAYADIDQAQASKLANGLTRVNIVLGHYYFSDGSMWLSGGFYIPTPPPELWKKVTPEEFFGHPAR
jgi:hypothetical protein